MKNISKLEKLNLAQLRQLAKHHHVPTGTNKPTMIKQLQQKLNAHNTQYINKQNIWNTITYNKTEKFPIQAINFPHITSLTPQTILVGSIIG